MAKTNKNAFSKCVLEFIFAPISGPYFFIFQKRSKSMYPNEHILRIIIKKLPGTIVPICQYWDKIPTSLTQNFGCQHYNHLLIGFNLPPSARQVKNPQRLITDWDSTFKLLSSCFPNIDPGKFANAISTQQLMQELNLNHP